jgi:hypothetical protein
MAKATKKRKKLRRSRTAAKLRILNQDNLLISLSTSKLYKLFGDKLLRAYIDKEKDYCKLLPLFNHEVKPSMRSKMVDWMVECFNTYSKSDETFFLSVTILDQFLHSTEEIYQDADIHLLGICAMFIASKYSDVFPL